MMIAGGIVHAIFAANAAAATQKHQQVAAFQTLWGCGGETNKNREYNLIHHHDGMNRVLSPPFLSLQKSLIPNSLTSKSQRSFSILFVKASSSSSSSSGGTEDDVGTSSGGDSSTDSISNSNNFVGDEDIWISGGVNFYPDFQTETPKEANEKTNDNENAINDSGNDADTLILASLKERTKQLQSESAALHSRWSNGSCKSSVHLQLDDWIRRIDIHKWPLAVVGTANGSIQLVNLETGGLLAMVEGAHSRLGGNPVALKYLHGDWDGGGPLAVAIMTSSANGSGGSVLVVSAGREGAAKVWKLDTSIASSSASPSSKSETKKEAESDKSQNEKKKNDNAPSEPVNTPAQLTSLGEISSLKKSMVTALHIDNDSCLWIATYDDSTLHGFDLTIPSSSSTVSTSSSGSPISLKRTMKVKLDTNKHILCMAVNEDIGLIAVGTARGTVELISMEEREVLGTWSPYSGSTHVRSVAIVPMKDEDGWCLVCGGGDGTMHILRNLAIDEVSGLAVGLQGSGGDGEGKDDDDTTSFSWSEEITPRHKGMVVSMTPCGDKLKGLFVSGAHDGTLRLWDCHGTDKGENSKKQNGDGDMEGEDNPSVTMSSSSPHLLYQLVGYKVWLGNVRVDSEGKRLLSDGSDNSVVVHDFAPPEEEEKKEN